MDHFTIFEGLEAEGKGELGADETSIIKVLMQKSPSTLVRLLNLDPQFSLVRGSLTTVCFKRLESSGD